MRRVGPLFVLLMLLAPAWGRAGQLADACAMALKAMPCHRPVQPPCHKQTLPDCCVIEAPAAPQAVTVASEGVKPPAQLFLIPTPGWEFLPGAARHPAPRIPRPAATPPPAPPPAHNLPLRV